MSCRDLKREKEVVKADVLIVASMDEEGRVTVSEEEMRNAAEHIAQKLNTSERRAA